MISKITKKEQKPQTHIEPDIQIFEESIEPMETLSTYGHETGELNISQKSRFQMTHKKSTDNLSTQDCSPQTRTSFISPFKIPISDEHVQEVPMKQQLSSVMMQRWITNNAQSLQPIDYNDTTQFLLNPQMIRKNQQEPEYAQENYKKLLRIE